MRRWGYRHVITPMVESTEVLELGLGAEQRRRLFKFTDTDGEVVAIVGERTIPVARLIAGKLRATPLPLRPCYSGPVLSSDAERFHQRRETYQVGAELVGVGDRPARTGHAEFFQGIMNAVKLPDAVKSSKGRLD